MSRSCNGSTQYGSATVPGFATSTAYATFAAWFMPSGSQGSFAGIIESRTGSLNGLVINSGTTFSVAWSSVGYSAATGLTIQPGKWNFGVGVINPSGIFAWFGVLGGPLQFANVFLGNPGSAAPTAWSFGRDPGGTLFSGLVAECALWNVSFREGDIERLFRGNPASMVRQGSLLGYWPLAGYDSPEPDLSPYHSAMALTASPPLGIAAPVYPPIKPQYFIPASTGTPGNASPLPAGAALSAVQSPASGAAGANPLAAGVAFSGVLLSGQGAAGANPLAAAFALSGCLATAQAAGGAGLLPTSIAFTAELAPAFAGTIAAPLPAGLAVSSAPLAGTGGVAIVLPTAGLAFSAVPLPAGASASCSCLPASAAFVAQLCTPFTGLTPGNTISSGIAFVAVPISFNCPGTPVAVSSSAADSVQVSSSAASSAQVGCPMIRTALTCPRGQAKTWTFSFCPPQSVAGMHFNMNIRQYYGGPIIQQANGVIVDTANGVYSCSFTASQTLLSPGPYVWDTWRTDAGSEDQLGIGPLQIGDSYWQ